MLRQSVGLAEVRGGRDRVLKVSDGRAWFAGLKCGRPEEEVTMHMLAQGLVLPPFLNWRRRVPLAHLCPSFGNLCGEICCYCSVADGLEDGTDLDDANKLPAVEHGES